MKNKTLKNILRSMLIIAISAPLASLATAYSPASFGSAEATLSKLITLPASFGEGVTTVAVYCQADVMTSGDINNVNCYENSPLISMQKSTESALKSATFEAAKIDDTTVPVRMQFRVIYSLNGTQNPIVMLPNLGTLQTQYGTHYVAPQERLDTNDWYVQYSTKDRGNGKMFFADSKVTRVMASVESNGNVESVNTIEAAMRKKSDANNIESALKKSKFIPGFVDNKATAMHYIAVVNYQK
jgi:hypothetical protein